MIRLDETVRSQLLAGVIRSRLRSVLGKNGHPSTNCPSRLLMITHNHFVSEFDSTFTDRPTSPTDHQFAAAGAGARAIVVAVEPWNGPSWTASFAGPDPGRRALTALVGTPSPTGLCVVERGTTFLGDVLNPDVFEIVATHGPVVAVEELTNEATLLLITPWAMTGVGRGGGALWTTPRVAVDGLRVDEANGGWVRGVADPEDDEPRDFAVNLATGHLIGGSATS